MFLQFIKRPKFFLATLFVAVFVLAFAVPAVYSLGDLGIVVEQLQDPETATRCPVCGRAISPGVVHTDARAIMMEKLKTALTDRNIGYSDGMKKDQPYINVLIYRFQERKGGNFAVEKPASIAFHMHLMKDKVVGKIFTYAEEQKALTQNLFTMGKFFRRGARWVTAEELAEEGINAGLDELVEPKGTTESAE
jgi:hypothetical protein